MRAGIPQCRGGNFMRTAVLFLFACAAFAQTDRGTITGTITDPTGAVIANAPIEARNVETAQVYPVVSTATGNFTVAQLPPGQYELDVTVAGFKKFQRRGMTLSPTQVMRIDITM